MKDTYSVIIGSIVLTLLVGGCNASKSAQCQKIYAIANDLVTENQSLSQVKEVSNTDLDRWLQGAETIEKAAQKMEALNLEDPQLVAYKNDWVEFQRIYAEATKEMVKARQDRDLTAAENANKNAVEAGKLEQQIASQINSYCQGN
jgi:valyl-tRNA synthetase